MQKKIKKKEKKYIMERGNALKMNATVTNDYQKKCKRYEIYLKTK